MISLLVFTNCSPSLYQLKQFDNAEHLNANILYIVINSNKEENRLIEKYKLKNKYSKSYKLLQSRNLKLLNAVKKYYTFSKYEIWDLEAHNYVLPIGFYTEEILFEVQNEKSIKKKIAFLIKDKQNNVITNVATDYNSKNINYKWLVQESNRRLIKLYKAGLRLQQ